MILLKNISACGARKVRLYGMLLAVFFIAPPFYFHIADTSYAQDIPASADPGRIKGQIQQPEIRDTSKELDVPSETLSDPPEGSEDLIFTLNDVQIEGMSVFEIERFEKHYKNNIGKDISASFIWELASEITKTYKKEGYFLSKAFVPAQKIDTGIVRIKVIEGHIAEIDIQGENADDRLIQSIKSKILAQKPTQIKSLESALLRLNDLYGIKFDAILGKKKGGQEGTVVLKLVQQKDNKARVILSTNNHGSRFVGPYRSSFSVEKSLLDYHTTTLSGLASIPNGKEVKLASLNHSIQITPSTEINFLLSKTASKPGFTLSRNNIESDSFSWGFGAQWLPIRQRDENLKVFGRLDILNSNTDTFGAELTRDRVRVLRAGAEYDFTDKFLGLNTIALTLSKGLGIFGASNKSDLNLSRAGAIPNFTKFEVSYTRQNYVADNLLLILGLNTQLASGSLYSSEEFGYGGVNFGRAYDFSEITGDQGVAAFAELQYMGFDPFWGYKVNPFVFYDIGKVWNKGSAATDPISASSTGLGVRVYGDNGLNFDALAGIPLTKSIDTPLYGNGKSVVFRFGLTYQFEPD